jgi:hypothetical protein
MADEDYGYPAQDFGNVNAKLSDLEERYRILKDRTILLGQNLIDIKENHDKKILEIKKDIEILRQNMERLLSFIESASEEFPKFAKKEDLEILYRQAKMFQPLNNLRKKI